MMASRREKEFVNNMRGRLVVAKSKLAQLATVTNPDAEKMAELEQAQTEVHDIKVLLE